MDERCHKTVIPPRPNSGLPEFGTIGWPKSDKSDLGWGGWPTPT
jgi:hypothetical protein